jgi:hypothetical protein
MDKKTLKRIIDNLRKQGLVQTKNFRVSIYQSNLDNTSDFSHDASVAEGDVQHIVKTVILAPHCFITDEQLMLDNETIANPTNKKSAIKTRA